MPEGETRPEFSTGLCECCAEPGGCGLCLQTSCCGCFVMGKNGEQLHPDHPGGFWLNCLASFVPFLNIFCVCQMGEKTLMRKGQGVPDQLMLALQSICCGACMVCRIRREQKLLGMSNQTDMCPDAAPAGDSAGASQAAALLSKKGPSYDATDLV